MKNVEEWSIPKSDLKRAAVIGIVVAGAALSGLTIFSASSGAEAIRLLEAMFPSVRFFCSAVMTATASILALMLTILMLGYQVESKLDKGYYDRIQQLARLDTFVFIAASLLLLLVSVPLLEESETIPAVFYQFFYYGLLLYTVALGGALIFVVMMLLNAIDAVIYVIHPGREGENHAV